MVNYGVTGATGQLGRLVVERLLKRVTTSDKIVVLVRDASKASGLFPPTVEARAADYSSPEAALRVALTGIDILLLISSSDLASGLRATHQIAVITAAVAAGVRHVVYTSLLHADTSKVTGLAGDHAATEEALRRAGVVYTILRNGWYHENNAQRIGGAAASGTLLGSGAGAKISGAARADFADAAVEALTRPTEVANKVLELAGDEAYGLEDLAAETSRQAGKPVKYVDVPVPEQAKVLAGYGVPEGFATLIAQWDADAAGGHLFDDSRTLSKLIGHPTTPVSAAVAAVLSHAAPAPAADAAHAGHAHHHDHSHHHAHGTA